MVSLVSLCCSTFLVILSNKYALRLSYNKIEFSEMDFITPLPPLLPYFVMANGDILRYHVTKPGQTDNPNASVQMDNPNASIQTDDPDATRVEDEMDTTQGTEDIKSK